MKPCRKTFPHFAPEPEFVQPDYRAWKRVEIGMSREDVVDLLGPPLDDPYRGGKARSDDPYYSYGHLQFPLSPHPRTYEFLIGFDDDRVFMKEDPFNGRFSEDGEPTTPEVITPQPFAVFDHYPRILDLRWYPSSGRYPMVYAVELSHYCRQSGMWSSGEILEAELGFPFFMTTFCGAQPGRFRVQARNEVGESPWSDYRGFEFTR